MDENLPATTSTPMNENSNPTIISNEQEQQQQDKLDPQPTQLQFKKALKRLASLEKQNAFLVDELVKSRQCLLQMKLEREVILDRVADSIASVEDDLDADEEEEEYEDYSVTSKKELIDDLLANAETDEAFAKVLGALSGYQSATSTAEQRNKKSSSSSTASTANAISTLNSSSSSSKKRSKPATSGSRFNRLSALTQAMRTGIISDDEGAAVNPSNLPLLAPYNQNAELSGYSDSDEFGFDGEEAELSQLKKIRRMQQQQQLQQNAAASPSIQSLLNNASKEESSVYKVISVPFDAQGNAVLPLSLNMITVHQLGQVVFDRPAYHNKRYILPVGFTTSRSYLSVVSPEGNMNYFSTILDNGPAPLYQVTPEGHPEMTFQSASTTGAWAAVSKAAAAVRGKDSAPSVSGPDYFGLANPTVSMLIERLPNSDKCESYAPKKYEVSNLVGGKNVKKAVSNNDEAPLPTTGVTNASADIDILDSYEEEKPTISE